eukprot:3630540-Prorocentrum_lima.AAC.1
MDTSQECAPQDATLFQQIIGVGQWLVTIGRYDIAFTVTTLSRFCANPRVGHLKRAVRLLGYLKKYPDHSVVYDPSPIELESIK